jgi:PAS domain S-box-containing protein
MKFRLKSIWPWAIVLLLAAGMALYVARPSDTPPIELAPEESDWLNRHRDSIRIAALPDSPPIDFVDENGLHRGLTSDYIRLIESRLGLRFIYVECASWEEILGKLKAREVDLVGSVQDTSERREFLRFTKPYLRVANVILTRKELDGTFNIDTMGGMRIAIVAGSATHDFIAGLHPEYTFVPVKDAATGFRMLSFQDVDAMVADIGVASYYIEELGISNLRVAGDIDYPWELRLASRKDWPFLNTILDKALESISLIEQRNIRRRWITLSDTVIIPRDRYQKIIGIVLLVTLAAIGLVVLWNRLLRRQVKHRTHELGRVKIRHEQAAQALDASEERFRSIVESSNDMIWEMDRYGNYTYVSARARDILGVEPHDLVGQNALSLMIPADEAKNLQKLRQATVNSTIDCEINTYVHRDGRHIVLESSGKAFANSTGALAGFRGVSRDITERIASEAALRESEERFRNLVETTSDWIWEIDTEGLFTYASPQVKDVLGYSPAELIGKNLMDLMPPKEAIATRTILADIVEQGAPIHSMINVSLHKDGHSVVLESSAVPFYDNEWNIMGYRGIGRDITDRMAAEKQLEFERNLFRTFMEHAPDLIFFKDADGRFIEGNTALANEMHLHPDELIGKTDFDLLPEAEAQIRFENELEVMRTEQPSQKEELITTPEGTRWFYTTMLPRYDEHGKVVGTIGTSWNITERKKAAEELRQLRALLSNIIDSMPSILVGVDLDGRVTQWNREAEQVTQTKAAEASGKPLREAFPELAKEMVKVERAIRERKTQKEERIPVHEGNRTRYSDVTVYPLLDNDAEGAVIRVDDVTERVLIEDSIRNIVEGVSVVGRQFFSSMVSQLAKVLDADLTFISEFSGDSHDTMHTIAVSNKGAAGDNFDYLLHGTPCEEVLRNGECISLTGVRQRFKDTEILQQLDIDSYIGIPLLDSEERPLGVMVAMYQTPIAQMDFATSIMQVFAGRTAAELERMQATKELLSLRNMLSNIINSMPSILVGVDSEGRVMQWNREAERITGIPASRAHGNKFDEVFPNLGEDMDRVLKAIGNPEVRYDERIPCMIKNELRYADVTVYPITSEGGDDGAVIRVDDVTNRVRIEEMMVQSEKMMSVGGLAAGMAHEINNPLAGILQNLQVMRNRITMNTDRNVATAQKSGTTMDAIQTYMQERGLMNMMDTVIDAGRRAAKIVDNMLSFSRKDEAHYAPHNLKDLMEKSLELAANDYNLKKRFDFRHIKIVRDYDDALEPIPCEGSQIQQVILNLLSNSAQAMADATNPPSNPCITLRLKREPSMLLIEVEDNGPGMDEETRKRAFEPFFTTKEVGHGTGLGLSVSYFIITENHGGTMQVKSAPGQGACFSIRLPYEHRKAMWGLRL